MSLISFFERIYHQLLLDDNVSRNFTTYCDNIRKTIKSLTIDLRSKEHMLQETIENWRIYHNLYETFEKWLIDGEQILRRSSDEKLVRKYISP